MELFAERTIAFILTNLSFSRRLTAWFGSEEGQKKLPEKRPPSAADRFVAPSVETIRQFAKTKS
jgi:hypothetical protein